MYDPLFSEKMKQVLCYGSQELTADKVYSMFTLQFHEEGSNAYERGRGIALNFMYFLANCESNGKWNDTLCVYNTALICMFIFHDSNKLGRNYNVNWGGGFFCPTSFFSNQLQIDQFEKKSVRQNMNI